jgi:uroporphyrinogen-III decarboxylase
VRGPTDGRYGHRVDVLGVDAAIIFADILPVEPLGARIEFAAGGPVIHNPIASAADVDRLTPVAGLLDYVAESAAGPRRSRCHWLRGRAVHAVGT